jgi:hypothetical protein
MAYALFGDTFTAYMKLYPAMWKSSSAPMMSSTTSKPSAPNMIDSWRRRLDALFSSPDM